MEYVVGQEITIPAIEDVCDAHKATVVEVHEDLLCVMTECGEYGEIDLECLTCPSSDKLEHLSM